MLTIRELETEAAYILALRDASVYWLMNGFAMRAAQILHKARFRQAMLDDAIKRATYQNAQSYAVPICPNILKFIESKKIGI
jgi:hypothetical protein